MAKIAIARLGAYCKEVSQALRPPDGVPYGNGQQCCVLQVCWWGRRR